MSSIREIARRARISPGTVDRVLHNRGRVSKATEQKVQRIVKELRYKGNIFARNLSLAKVFHFGVVMPKLAQDSGYWRITSEGINRAHQELQAYRVSVNYFHYDRFSETSFRRAIGNAVKLNPDGLLIAPVLSSVAREIINGIPEHIPYVFFDSHVPGTKYLSTIGKESVPSGILAAKLMHILIPPTGNGGAASTVALVRVLPADVHIDERIRGFQSYMKSFPHITTVVYDVDSNDREEAFHLVLDEILRRHLDLRGVFVSNAWTYPVANYVKANGLGGNIRIVGYEVVPRNVQHLREGTIDFILSPRPEMQGYYGIYCLYRHVALKEIVRKKLEVPVDILTRENIEYYRGGEGD
jgi:LacI family transcriptional regulator